MKRIVFALSVLGFLGISYSARGEHSGATSGGRTIVTVPAISAGERINELINACSINRPFPGLRTRQIDLTPPTTTPPAETTPPGDAPPSLPPGPPTTTTPTNPPTDTPPTSGNRDSGQAIYTNRCAKCHESGMAPNIKGNPGGVAKRTADGSMPSDGSGALSAAEQADLVAFIQSSN